MRYRSLAAVVLSTLLAAPAFGQMRRKFDFARAEAIADKALGRTPVPFDKKPAQAVPKPLVGVCRICKGEAVVKCPQHKNKPAVLIEGRPQNRLCPVCMEMGFIPCPGCRQKRARQAEWKQAVEKFKTATQTAQVVLNEINSLEAQGLLGYRMAGYVAPHFSIGSNVSEGAALTCVAAGDGLIDKLNAEFKAERFSFTGPVDTRFYFTKSVGDYQRFLTTVWRMRSPNTDIALALKGAGIHSHATPSTSVSCYEHILDKKRLAHHFVHTLGHFLIARVEGDRDAPPWIDEGFAAHCETIQLRTPQVYCFAYATNEQDITRRRDATLKMMARQNQLVPMERLTQMNFASMKPKEYFQAWSMVTMLIERDPDKFLAFLKALPEPEFDPGGARIPAEKQEEAMKATYGYDYKKLVAVWRQYVLAR